MTPTPPPTKTPLPRLSLLGKAAKLDRWSTLTPEELDAAYTPNGANVGYRLDHLAVVDCDTPEGVAWWLDHGPPTPYQSIGRPERRSFWYRRPVGDWRTHMLDDDRKIQVRTGMSHQCAVPPSVHPDTGQPYRWAGPPVDATTFDNLPVFPTQLLMAARVREAAPAMEPGRHRIEDWGSLTAEDTPRLLAEHGWTPDYQGRYWTRPGKLPDEGHGAELFDDGYLRVYTDATVFPPNENYSPWAVHVWLEHGGDFAAARRAQALALAPAPAQGLAPTGRLLTWSQATERPDPEFLIPGFVRAGPGALSVLAAGRGTGKTFLALRWVARLGRAGARILYGAGEMPAPYRFTDARDNPRFGRPNTLQVGDLDGVTVHNGSLPVYGPTADTWPEGPWDLVVLDTLARHIRGDENETADMTAFVHALATLPGTPPVLVLHHFGRSARRSRGSVVLEDAADVVALAWTEGGGFCEGGTIVATSAGDQAKMRDGSPATVHFYGERVARANGSKVTMVREDALGRPSAKALAPSENPYVADLRLRGPSTTADVARRHEVSSATARSALGRLAEDGSVYRVEGGGGSQSTVWAAR